MGILSYINRDIYNERFSDVLYRYDKDKNGLSRKEFRSAVNGVSNIWARQIVKLTAFDKVMFKRLNKDKDQVLSYDEMADYIKKEYGLDFYSFMNMTIKEVCDVMTLSENSRVVP